MGNHTLLDRNLVKQRLIFDCGKRGGRSGKATVYVAAMFRDHYPEAWDAAQAALDGAVNARRVDEIDSEIAHEENRSVKA